MEALQAELDAGVNVEKKRVANQVALGTLDAKHLEEARGRISRFVDDLGLTALGERLAAVPEIELLAKRWVGLRNQHWYLRQMRQELLDKMEAQFSAQLTKLRQKVVKNRRPKKQYRKIPAQEYQRSFMDRTRKYQQRFDRYDRGYQSISSFSSYEDGYLSDDCLWWDVFTGGRDKGTYLPDVQRFRSRHPQYRYVRPKRRDDDEALAAAAVANADQLDDLDDSTDFS